MRETAEKGQARLTGDFVGVGVVIRGRVRRDVDENETDAAKLSSAALSGHQCSVVDCPESVGGDDRDGETELGGEGPDVEAGTPR